MRFARLQCDSDAAPLGMEELLHGPDVDWLQLDYPRVSSIAVEPGVRPELPAWPHGFADALRGLGPALFLEPNFRVIASAGWADAYACVEQAAGALVGSGCGDVPVSAVRGSNVLPILDMLVADGVDLRNVETGARWRDLKEPLLAADLQLGAGPIATALAEEARVIVAGWYDATAPSIAMAVHELGWTWIDYDRLAAAAVAANCASWFDWEGPSEAAANGIAAATAHVRAIELSAKGEISVQLAQQASPAAAARLLAWLTASRQKTAVEYADVHVETAQLRAGVAGSQSLALEGAIGRASDRSWLLEVLYQTGFTAEALIELDAGAHPQLRKHIVKVAKKQLHPPGDGGAATIKELHPAGDGVGPSWIHLAYHSKSHQACRRFAELTLELTSAFRPWLRLASGAPAVMVNCGVWPARVPRDAVDIAVETRLAKEWT
ncbi:MAG: acyclic terpene utilization AtuA family protein [Pirellulales bacterium]|nr:acyclic terpene utilization AtuA family protein [Pirellulales bacterium]